MLVFWIFIVLICLFTLWLLWRPLNGDSVLKMESIQQRNIAIANERALEITSAFDAGDIEATERDQAMKDLEMSLADELATSSELKDQFSQGSRLSTLAVLVLTPLLAYGVYSLTTNYQPDWVSEQERLENAEAPPLEDILAQLETAVAANPQDQRGLYLLASSYAQLGRYADSAKRFEQLILVSEPDADLLVSYVDASAMANDRRFSEQHAATLDKALALKPDHITGLWLAGMAAQQLGHPETALRHWLTLRPILASNPDASQELELLIGSAREEVGIVQAQNIEAELAQTAQTSPGIEAETPAVGAATITLNVSLAPELQSEVSATDTVFVFARAKNGPPMPLAAARQPVSKLPLSVQLDDSMAMMPQMKLSSFKDIVVGARISKSGQATAQTGDLESELVTTVNTHPDTIELIISKKRL